MTIADKIVPNLVGVDIGCGMEVIKLANRRLELHKLDKLIYKKIPSGFNIRDREHKFNAKIDLTQLKCKDRVKLNRARRSIGTLGGGNHFIEINKDNQGNLYLVVHSGSRHLGHEVASLYQREAQKSLKSISVAVPSSLAYLTGQLFNNYIYDMKIVQRFALLNRQAIVEEILKGMELEAVERFTSIHNYIDTENLILRKGAVSAQKGEKLLIPLNMRDGSLICIGKGNAEWNYSAPHGAGRIMSRTEAKQTFTMAEYKETMEGIFTTSVSKATLDECPLAYKPMAEIVENIGDTAEILETIRPIYNFKAAE
jgi:RNA-splicing ligase RtcB